MNPSDEKDLYFYFGQFWPVAAVGVIIYLGGEAAKKVVHIWVPQGTEANKQPFWYKLWYATIDWHPILVGGLLGAIPWPVPTFVMHWWVRMLWFALVGACSGQIYRSIKKSFDMLPELARKKAGLPEQAPSVRPESDEAAAVSDANGGDSSAPRA